MNTFKFELAHSLLTPFKNQAIDYETLEQLIEFHIATGADIIAIPTHTGESVSLQNTERKDLLKFVVKVVNQRVPILVNVSDSGTDIASDLARSAKELGASALMACTPYYWTPPEHMLLEHFKRIGQAGDLPFFVYNSPEEMAGVKVTTKLTLSLIKELPHFSGIIDCSHDWQYMIEVISESKRIKQDFQLISGTEYMISAGAIGATGLLSNLTNLTPNLIRKLYDLCQKEDYKSAYQYQVDAALLYRLFNEYGIAGLKHVSKTLNRDLGLTRAPLQNLSQEQVDELMKRYSEISDLGSEPLGWYGK